MNGYSRLITILLCATNNPADTCLKGFQEGVARYGIPERVRGDNGGENNGVEMFMMEKRGGESYLRGPSVHNQRIERLHYDTTHAVLSLFINIFKFMESHELLSPNNVIHLFALHFVFKTKIQTSLDEFREGWNCHRLSSEKNLTPYQIFMLGALDSSKQNQIGIESLAERDWSSFGVEFLDIPPCNGEDEDTVILNDITLGGQEHNIQTILGYEFDPSDDDGNFGINMYMAVKTRIEEIHPNL